jgi:hypothetical protein
MGMGMGNAGRSPTCSQSTFFEWETIHLNCMDSTRCCSSSCRYYPDCTHSRAREFVISEQRHLNNSQIKFWTSFGVRLSMYSIT